MKKRNNIVLKSLFHSPLKIFILTIFYIFTAIFATVLSKGLGEAFDIGISGSTNEFRTYAIKLVITLGLLLVFQFLAALYEQKYYFETLKRTRVGIFNEINKKPLYEFIKKDYGDYSSSLINDVKLLEEQFFHPIRFTYDQIIGLIIAVVFLIRINIWITIYIILASFIPLLIPKLLENKLSKKFSDYSTGISNYTMSLNELLDGYNVIKTYNAENAIKLRHNKINKETLTIKRNAYNFLGVVSNVTAITSAFVMIGALLIGMFLAIYDILTVGEVFAIAFISGNITGPLSVISSNISNIKGSKDIIQKFDIKEYDKDKLVKLNNINESIEFKNYSLTINKPILKDINYTFEKGKKYAIVGGSGSGKSSLIKSILGYYYDYSGEILVDGVELKSIDINSLYDNISYIPQNVSFFQGTIRDNLSYFNSNLNSKLIEALEFANIDRKIKNLPDKLDTEIDKNIAEFSGGEKQRIGIARSVVHNKEIFILDEATSALDGKNYTIVENNILEKDITLIAVTHRLDENILEKYDEIIVLDKGRIVENGTFKELMNNESYFYQLYFSN
ncbi:ABC transporter ATP-binding protein [Keratinibaculum paraultunense]|uniref:ABC transporter ATP-binding protein n=1 Tax=Keratinibaculum paraultunense TaxID=1278232 RepID=UPI00192B5A6F|nr:ABC transporter ATP-binding protein [Keratinibaculum paraultunense]QQY79711.1 ABC transporter ATP-binding protein [Keratinibaculum paraultunense]